MNCYPAFREEETGWKPEIPKLGATPPVIRPRKKKEV